MKQIYSKETKTGANKITKSEGKGHYLKDNRAKTVQRKANNTGLPDKLKSGIENLSGHSMDDVKVHYNSSKPAQLNAHAFAQGSSIHIASGQEKHLAHEAWHVVQQKQGRVKPTKQLKSKVNINDDVGLEKEADVMGAKALQMNVPNSSAGNLKKVGGIKTTGQRVVKNAVIQMKLPLTVAGFGQSHQALVDATTAGVVRDNVSKHLMMKFGYAVEFLKPFLENREEMIKQLPDVPGRANQLKKVRQQLMVYRALFEYGKTHADLRAYKMTLKKQRWDPIVELANEIPDMAKTHALAGGYQEYQQGENVPSMGGLQKKLTNLPSHESMHTGKPGVEGLDVPIIKSSVFMGSKDVPSALKRIIKDIYLHWKLRIVLDKKTHKQKNQRAKTPDGIGSLRTWHMNGHASLPRVNGNPTSHPLHQHYSKNSQAGNVHEGGAPIGYAEYTGIDSDQNKIVLNYINGHIFVTAVHYKYWEEKDNEPARGLSGSLSNSKTSVAPERHDKLRSPWIRVDMG